MTYNSTFQDRLKNSAEAKQKALEKLRAKPKADPALLAEQKAARLAKEAEEAARREADRQAKLAAIEKEKADKIAAAEAAAAAAAEEEARAAAERKAKAPPTAAELKALRDARYAARKARQR